MSKDWDGRHQWNTISVDQNHKSSSLAIWPELLEFSCSLIPRIPLGLFPVETQNRILGLPTTSEAEAEEDKYISSSSFRRVARLAVVGHLPSRHLLPPALPTAPNALNTETLQKATVSDLESAGVPSRQLTPPSLPPVASFAREVLPRDNSLRWDGLPNYLLR